MRSPLRREGETEAVEVEILGRSTLQEALVLGDTVLIGQTILERMDLHVDCQGRRLLPNPEHPDRPELRVWDNRRKRRNPVSLRNRVSKGSISLI